MERDREKLFRQMPVSCRSGLSSHDLFSSLPLQHTNNGGLPFLQSLPRADPLDFVDKMCSLYNGELNMTNHNAMRSKVLCTFLCLSHYFFLPCSQLPACCSAVCTNTYFTLV